MIQAYAAAVGRNVPSSVVEPLEMRLVYDHEPKPVVDRLVGRGWQVSAI